MEDWEVKMLAQNLAIAESVRPDLIEMRHIRELRLLQAKDAVDPEMKRKLNAYIEAIEITFVQIESILDYPRRWES